MIKNRTFWNIVKPFLSNRTKKQGEITLVKKDETVLDDKKTLMKNY